MHYSSVWKLSNHLEHNKEELCTSPSRMYRNHQRQAGAVRSQHGFRAWSDLWGGRSERVGQDHAAARNLWIHPCGYGHGEHERQVVEFNRKLPDSVGVIIENPGFVLSETGMQNLKYLAGINKDFDSDETERLLKEFGLWEHADEKMKSYSLGMRQKLAIVQALMEHQNLILLDEPTNGLDEQSVGVFLEEMRRQREQGKTVIIASHHRDELNLIADQFHSMASGRLHAA